MLDVELIRQLVTEKGYRITGYASVEAPDRKRWIASQKRKKGKENEMSKML